MFKIDYSDEHELCRSNKWPIALPKEKRRADLVGQVKPVVEEAKEVGLEA